MGSHQTAHRHRANGAEALIHDEHLEEQVRQRLARKILQSVVADGASGLFTMLGVQVTDQFRNTVIGVISSVVFAFFLAIFVEGKVG